MNKLEKFFNEVQMLRNKPENKRVRTGQLMMNVLEAMDKNLYSEITMKGDCDPFHSDIRIPAFCSILAGAWDGEKA